MITVGLVGAGAMGSGLGAAWRAAGARVVTSLAGRSDRTRRLVEDAGITTLPALDDVVAAADLLVSVVPPQFARQVADDVGAAVIRTDRRPLFVDLNAISPQTMREVVSAVGLDTVDGSISGPPPRADATTRIFLSGPRAAEVVAVPSQWIETVIVGPEVGTASAVKMCTASLYKGMTAIVMQALLTAHHQGVVDHVLADAARAWPDEVTHWHLDVAASATKAWRFIDEMREIAATQASAGLPRELFDGVAAAYERASHTSLGEQDPESVDASLTIDEILDRLT